MYIISCTATQSVGGLHLHLLLAACAGTWQLACHSGSASSYMILPAWAARCMVFAFFDRLATPARGDRSVDGACFGVRCTVHTIKCELRQQRDGERSFHSSFGLIWIFALALAYLSIGIRPGVLVRGLPVLGLA